MSWIINWQIEEMVDDVPHEQSKEHFIIVSPGKLPVSFKVPNNATASQIEVEKEKAILKAKVLLLESLLKEVGVQKPAIV